MLDTTATPLEKILLGIGDSKNFIKDKVLDKFNRQRRPSDLNVLRAYLENTEYCVDLPYLNEALANIQDPTQPLFVDSFGRSIPTAINTLNQIGFGGGKTVRYQVVIGDILVEKFAIDDESLKRWSFVGCNSDPKIKEKKKELAKIYAYMEMYMSLLDKLETASVAHLNTALSTGGGAGIVYPPNVDTKEIPLADSAIKYNGIYTEAMDNKYLYSADEKLMLLSNTSEFMDYNQLNALGNNNQSDQSRTQLALFDHRRSISLNGSVGGYKSVSYLIKRGGIGMTTWAGQAPLSDNTNKLFSQHQVPDIGSAYGIDVAKGIGGLNFNYFENRDVANDFLTYTTEESYLNPTVLMTLSTRPVFLLAQSEIPGDTAVIKYGQMPV